MKKFYVKFAMSCACLFCFVANSSAQLVFHPSQVSEDSISNFGHNSETPFYFEKNPLIAKAQNAGLDDIIADVDTVGAEKFYVGKDSLTMYCKTTEVQGRKGKMDKRHCWIPDAPEAVQKPVKIYSCTDDCPITEASWDREQKMKERKKDKRDPHEKDMDRERNALPRQFIRGFGTTLEFLNAVGQVAEPFVYMGTAVYEAGKSIYKGVSK